MGKVSFKSTLPRLKSIATMRLLLMLVAICGLLFFIIVSTFSKTRTFLIEAQTTAATIRFVGDSNIWMIPNAAICRLKAQPDLTQEETNDPCDRRFYDVEKQDGLVAAWRDGMTVKATVSQRNELVIGVENDVMPSFQDGTKIILSPEAWREAGALTFAAQVTIGTPIGDGEINFLSGGRWEAREAGFTTGMLRSNVTEVIKSGELVRGGTATVWSGEAPAETFGHITPGASLGGDHMDIVALSRPGDVELHLGYFGTTKPTVVRPDLIDAAISNPLLLALAIILSIFASASQFYGDVRDRRGAVKSRQ